MTTSEQAAPRAPRPHATESGEFPPPAVPTLALGADDLVEAYDRMQARIYALERQLAHTQRRAVAAEKELRTRWEEHADGGCGVCEPWQPGAEPNPDDVCRRWRSTFDVLAASAAPRAGGEAEGVASQGAQSLPEHTPKRDTPSGIA